MPKDIDIEIEGRATGGKDRAVRGRTVKVTHYEGGWNVKVTISRNGGKNRFKDVIAVDLRKDEVFELRKALQKAAKVQVKSLRRGG